MGARQESDRSAIGAKLRECREYLGYSQDEVASTLGLSRSAISLIETGQRKIEVLELRRFSELYERPLSYFTNETFGEPALPSAVQALARQAAKLKESDLNELARFVEFLASRPKAVKRK